MARIVDAAGAVGAKVLLDGAQAVPHGAIDVRRWGSTSMPSSGHKMFAPNGIGGLWAKRDLLEEMPPFMGGGEMIRSVTMEKTSYAPPPHKFEAGTPADCPGSRARGRGALGDGARWRRGHGARQPAYGRILEGLGARDSIRIIGPEGLQGRAPVISFDIANVHPHDVCTILDGHGVALRGGHHCAQPLMDHFDLAGTTRASLACYNDDADVDALLEGIDDAIADWRETMKDELYHDRILELARDDTTEGAAGVAERQRDDQQSVVRRSGDDRHYGRGRRLDRGPSQGARLRTLSGFRRGHWRHRAGRGAGCAARNRRRRDGHDQGRRRPATRRLASGSTLSAR